MMWKPTIAGLALALIGGLAQADSRPAVVELFTSQGCSSCPPADRYLGELAQRGDVIALAYHVDYWDNLGWKDPFASADATDRQRKYSHALRLSGLYTPQMVVDGATDAVGSDRGAVQAALSGSHQGPAIRLTPANGTLKIAIDALKDAPQGDITLVAYSKEAETKVLRGENAGRMLKEYSIVRGVLPLGHWTGAATELSVDLAKLPADATAVALLVQTPGQGRMIGAAAAPIR